MLISEFDLCKREWLELVFANRNKKYGAYQLRSNYNNIMGRAIGLTFFMALVASVTIGWISHHRTMRAEPTERSVIVDIAPPPAIKLPKKVEPPQEAKLKQAAPKAEPVSTQRVVAPVVKPDRDVHEDMVPVKPDVAIGSENIDIPGSKAVDNAQPGKPEGTGTTPTVDNDVHPAVGLDVMPEPVGGEGAWIKFLQKNLRYPAMAQENNLSGRVYVTFIIEKDGHLSDISILRKAGSGFDEEALRVLHKAPAWNPGKQNGQNVRVRYTIPINFQINQE